MHCPVCGAESTQGLNYCKRCGASIVAGKQASRPALDVGKLTGMFWAVAVFGLGGLSLFVGGLLGLVAMGVDTEKLTILGTFSILPILIISVLLIIQLSRLVSTVTGSAEICGAVPLMKPRIRVDCFDGTSLRRRMPGVRGGFGFDESAR